MLRRALIEKAPEVVEGFRMRGTEVSRMEAFVDCVFGFGLTLLVVSSQVPAHFAELLVAMRGMVVFGMCFALFYGVWSRHYTFCRRYGLEDLVTRFLTLVLLFVMLGYLYPLKFLATIFSTIILHIDVGWKPAPNEFIDMGQLFIIYGVGFAAIHVVFMLLYMNAYRLRNELRLDELEQFDTKWWALEQALYCSVPLLSIVLVLVLPPQLQGFPGWCYFLMGFVGWFHGSMHGRRHEALVQRLEREGRLSAAELNTENDLVEVAG